MKDQQREKWIRDGRSWVSTHMDMSHPWPISEECALQVAQMLNAGRDGWDVRQFVANYRR